MKSYRTNEKRKPERVEGKKGQLVTAMLVVFFWAFLVYKDVSLSSWVIYVGAVLAFLFLLIRSFGSAIPALVALVCYVPFSKILVGDFGGGFKALNFTNILMIFVFIGMLSQLTTKGKPLFSKNSLNLPILFFCLLTSISFIKASFYFGYYWDFLESLSQVKRWLTAPLIFYLTFNALEDKESTKMIVKIMMFVVVIVGLMATFDYMNVGDVSNLDKARIGGIAEQPNQLAGFFVYYMFLYAGFFLVYFPTLSAWLFILPLLITFRGIMVTFSRGGYISFALGGLAISFFKNKLFFIIITAGFVLAILNPQLLPGGIRYRMGQTIEGTSDFSESSIEDSLEPSAARRVDIWKTAIEMIKDQPLWGFGYGTFPYVLGSYNGFLAGKDAHNSYIIIAAEMGIPALLSFLFIVFIFFKETLWVYRKASDKFFRATALGMLGGIFGLLAVNMFGSRLSTLEVSGYFWMLAGVILRMKMIIQEEMKKETKNVPKSKI
jgi:O-antigen ligase